MSVEPANRDEEILQQLQSPAFLIELRQQMLKFAILQLSSFQLAEDAVQEALASAYQHISSFTGRAAFKTWVSKNEEKSSVHNYFLLITIEQGLPGLLLLFVLLINMFTIAVKGYHVLNDPFERSLSMLCAVVLSMVVTLNLLSDLIETDKIGSIYFLLLGLLIRVQTKINEQQGKNAPL